jgi:hypothetical protein
MKRLTLALSLGLVILAGSVQTAGAYWNEYYMPQVGISYINNHPDTNYNIRFTNQDMFWRSHNLQAYNYWNDIYEHETIFYDHEGQAFARTFVNSDWWSSNLPGKYLDTQSMDDPDEPNITVGSFDPTEILPNTYYNYYVALNKTSSPGSFYKIQGQKSYSYCEFSPWCVPTIQDSTKVIPFAAPYAFQAPEYRTFRYEWESNNSSTVADRISLGQWGSGVIANTSDADWFIFNVPSSKTVAMILKLSSLGANNYNFELYRKSTGQYIGGSYNGAGEHETLTTYLTSGDYLIMIYSAAGSDDNATYHFIAN